MSLYLSHGRALLCLWSPTNRQTAARVRGSRRHFSAAAAAFPLCATRGRQSGQKERRHPATEQKGPQLSLSLTLSLSVYTKPSTPSATRRPGKMSDLWGMRC